MLSEETMAIIRYEAEQAVEAALKRRLDALKAHVREPMIGTLQDVIGGERFVITQNTAKCPLSAAVYPPTPP